MLIRARADGTSRGLLRQIIRHPGRCDYQYESDLHPAHQCSLCLRARSTVNPEGVGDAVDLFPGGWDNPRSM